jgi:hypothetical protein
MSTDMISVNLKCLKCGGVPMTDDDSVTDSSIVKCKSCGQIFGTYAEVKAKAVDTVREHVVERFKDMFKKS